MLFCENVSTNVASITVIGSMRLLDCIPSVDVDVEKLRHESIIQPCRGHGGSDDHGYGG